MRVTRNEKRTFMSVYSISFPSIQQETTVYTTCLRLYNMRERLKGYHDFASSQHVSWDIEARKR